MKRKLLPCAALASVAGLLWSPTTWTEPVTEGAKQWLERMIQATQTLNYEGTFVYVQGPHVEAMRIFHGYGADGERQRLFSLNGPPREIVVAKNSVTCLLPKQKATFGNGDGYHSSFPISIPRELGRLETHYAFEVLGEDRVAGLETQVVAIKPRDTWRFGYRLWLDQRNGMVLRSVLLDEQSRPIEQLMFTDLQVKAHIDDVAFDAEGIAGGVPAPVPANPNGDNAMATGEPVTESAWQVGPMPDGFVKVLHNRFVKAPGRYPTEHLVFADGLATISVFFEKLDGGSALLQGESQLGSMSAFGTTMDGYQVLVVGEVPLATVQRIATSIQHDATADKP